MMKKQARRAIILLEILAITILMYNFVIAAGTPQAPGFFNVTANETKASASAAGQIINISGGYIATINMTAQIKNTKWKGFVGWVSGTFTLQDSAGSTLYDWRLSSITGRVYATRNSTSVSWTSINCSNISHLELENYNMNHSSPDYNITRTFNATWVAGRTLSGQHTPFWVGTRYIYANTCPTVKTYVENATSGGALFEEVALYDGFNAVYATPLESNEIGFDSNRYDFQMIVPENGLNDFTGATAYYVYVELD